MIAMKKVILSIAMASGLMLAGCNTVIDPATLAAIQAAAVAECNFLPTEVQIASLFPTAAPVASQIGTIGDIICRAVVAQVPKSSRHRGASLRGVSVNVTMPDGSSAVVTGTFVR